MDDTNFDLIKTLSVRANADWHDKAYREEVRCEGCRKLFAHLHGMDQEAVRLLTEELIQHVRAGAFPGEALLAG